MIRGIAILALVAAASAAGEPAAIPAPGDGAPGWGRLRWGMTADEVLAAVPGAVRLEPALRLADGNLVAVGMDRLEVASTAFRLRFVFDGNGLALLSLRTPPERYADGVAFDAVARHLEARWGPPDRAARDAGLVEMRQTRWRLGPSTVDLEYIPGVVVILYHPAAVREPPPARGG